MVDAEIFSQALDIPISRAEDWLPHLKLAMEAYGILSMRQRAAFLAQCHHESMGFQRVRENMNYSTPQRIRNVWPFRFRSLEDAKPYVMQPEKLANYVYANRNGNGDQWSGDGWRFRGRGLLQITGKSGYTAAGSAMDLPLLLHPEMLETHEFAAASAAWYWKVHGLNNYADLNDIDSISGIINRGDPHKTAHGEDERRELFVHCCNIMEA